MQIFVVGTQIKNIPTKQVLIEPMDVEYGLLGPSTLFFGMFFCWTVLPLMTQSRNAFKQPAWWKWKRKRDLQNWNQKKLKTKQGKIKNKTKKKIKPKQEKIKTKPEKKNKNKTRNKHSDTSGENKQCNLIKTAIKTMRQHQAVSRLQTDELFNLLNDKLWYSFSPSFLCKKLSCTDSQLKHRIFALRTLGIQVNEFVWNERPFIGLESRRIQYEKDKVNGTNHVEHLIKQGAYS